VEADEVALAPKTLRGAHAHLGSSIPIAIEGQNIERRMRVVGVAVLPVESDVSTLGEGALVAESGLAAFMPDVVADTLFVRYSAGADRARVTEAVEAATGRPGSLNLPSRPSTLVDFGRVQSLPLVLAGLLALLTFATLTHVLISSVRRRRRELAVLKTIGLVSGQLRAVVIWQALTMSVLSLAIGLPLGVAAGRWIWLVLARHTGFVPEVVTEFVPLAAVCGAAVALSTVLAWFVGGAAARTPPAMALRSE